MSQPLSQEQIQAVWNEVYDESDRGCVLLCAALLDRELGTCLRRKFQELSTVSDEDINKVLMDYPTAALLSFSSRARVAHLLGIIPKEVSQALRQLAIIRNAFAHQDVMPPLSMGTLKPVIDSLPAEQLRVVDHIEELWKVIKETEPTGKFRLISIAVVLSITLTSIAEAIVQRPQAQAN